MSGRYFGVEERKSVSVYPSGRHWARKGMRGGSFTTPCSVLADDWSWQRGASLGGASLDEKGRKVPWT